MPSSSFVIEFRPMDAFIGNEEIVAYLRRSWENGTLFHAFLFVGPDGIGKRTFAEILARSLLCPEKSFGGCGACPICHHISARTHPDFFYVSKDEEKTEVTVDQIRSLRESLSHTSFFSGPHVVVIDDAESMNGNAANALLKQLEEAPNIYFFLLAESARSVPETVQSRVQRFDFQPLHQSALSGDPTVTPLALGAPGRLNRFTQEETSRAKESERLHTAHILLTASRIERMREIDRVFGKATFADQRAIAFPLMRYLVTLARDQLRTSPTTPNTRRAAGTLLLFKLFDQDVSPRISMERFVSTL